MTTTSERMIKRALTPDDTVRAPAALGEKIYQAIAVTPQRRSALAWPRAWLPGASSAVRMAFLMLLLGALLLLTAIALSQVLLKPSILMYRGGPDRTGVMPGPGPVGNPVVAWEAQLAGAVSPAMMPLVTADAVVIADDSGTVSAFDEKTGRAKWSLNIGSPIGSTPVIVGRQVIVCSVAGAVFAIDVDHGHELWRTTLAGRISAAPVFVEDALFVGTQEGNLYELDATGGVKRSELALGTSISRGPAVANGAVYVGVDDGSLWALDRDDLRTLWRVELGTGGIGTPAFAGGALFLGRGIDALNPPRGVVALSPVGGAVLWAFSAPAEVLAQLGAVGGGRVFAVSDDHNVYALGMKDGALEWTHPTGGPVTSLAALVGDVLYVASTDDTIRALDSTTGALVWSIAVAGDPTSPAVINGRVYVGTSHGRLIAIGGDGQR